jgi:hypothetical protein
MVPGGLSLPGILLFRAPNPSQHRHWYAALRSRLKTSLSWGIEGVSRCAVQLKIIVLFSSAPFPRWARATQIVKTYTTEHERRAAEFDKLDPPASEFELLDERIKLDFAIHELEWSTVAEMTYAKSA